MRTHYSIQYKGWDLFVPYTKGRGAWRGEISREIYTLAPLQRYSTVGKTKKELVSRLQKYADDYE